MNSTDEWSELSSPATLSRFMDRYRLGSKVQQKCSFQSSNFKFRALWYSTGDKLVDSSSVFTINSFEYRSYHVGNGINGRGIFQRPLSPLQPLPTVRYKPCQDQDAQSMPHKINSEQRVISFLNNARHLAISLCITLATSSPNIIVRE